MINATRGQQDEATVATHYDQLDPVYRGLWGEHLHHGLWRRGDEPLVEAQINLIELVARHLHLGAGMRICDVGCGYGASMRWLAEHWNVDVTGLTISQAQYEYACAAELKGPRPTYLLRSWLDNRLPSELFDGIFAIESTAHIDDLGYAFREVSRVLKPGGRLVICGWSTTPELRSWQVKYLIEPICREARLPHMASGAEYRALIEDSGLVVIHTEDLSDQVLHTSRTAVVKIGKGILTDRAVIRYLCDPRSKDRAMLLAMLHIPAAYRAGCMKYELITAQRPSWPDQSGGGPSREAMS